MMLQKEIEVVEGSFKEYYFNHFDMIHVPPLPRQREFGYQKINGNMIRHLSIKDDRELHLLLMKETPSDVYCSNAYYSFPNLPMSEKDWKGADLIFDIDAKDMGLSCRPEHSVSKCESCKNSMSGINSKCPKCDSTKVETKSVTCKNCLTESKKQVRKLVDMLTSDLGIRNEEIEVYFSGNEGFHIRVINDEYQQLGSQERSEIVDYIMFNNAMPESFGMKRHDLSKTSFPGMNEEGWRGRVARNLFQSKTKAPKIAKQIVSGGYMAFASRLEEIRNNSGVKIDPKVTMDIHRIFRLEGSINSKSGLSKVLCKDLESCDPFTEACLLGDEEIDVIANSPVSFKLRKKKFGPYQNERISLPKYAAVYMICKGLATVP